MNVKANWDKINIEGPVYIGGMTHIEDGSTIHRPQRHCQQLATSAAVPLWIKASSLNIPALALGYAWWTNWCLGAYCVDKSRRFQKKIDMKAAALDWLITDTRQEFPTEPHG